MLIRRALTGAALAAAALAALSLTMPDAHAMQADAHAMQAGAQDGAGGAGAVDTGGARLTADAHYLADVTAAGVLGARPDDAHLVCEGWAAGVGTRAMYATLQARQGYAPIAAGLVIGYAHRDLCPTTDATL